MNIDNHERAQNYYDQFSETYEKHRHHGYHVLLDELEVEITKRYLGQRVLEAGCGTGLILQRLHREANMTVGIDLSAGMLSLAKQRGLRVAQSGVNQLPFADNYFDTVVSFKVLAHVPQIEAALAELCRVTRPGGHLVLEFYNLHSLRTLIKKLKNPTTISASFHDEDVYTRYDSLADIRRYLPDSLQLVDIRGVRVFTPTASVHQIPLFGSALRKLEHWAADAPIFKRYGGFLIVVLKKQP